MKNYPSIKTYIEDDSARVELEHGQKYGLDYVGHKLMVPQKDDYYVLPNNGNRYILFNAGDEKFYLISNICTHRQSILVEGKGKLKNITCRLHCWTFNTDGKHTGSPFFTEEPKNVDLETITLYEWNGLLFKNRIPDFDLKKLDLDEYFNFSGYKYISTESERYEFNWKIFMEIYLENYHVFSMHPGLRKYVNPRDLEWLVGDDYSVQKVGMGKDLTNGKTEVYKQWQDVLMEQFGGSLPKYGAIWGLIYPNIMLEWYPHVIVVSTVIPDGAKACVNHVEFYYNEEVYNSNPEYFTKEMNAYMETAREDNEACLLLQKGREALYLNGEEKFGPIEPFLEKGVSEFYNFLAR